MAWDGTHTGWIDGKDAAAMADAVSGYTLADTLGYVSGLIEAAKAAK